MDITTARSVRRGDSGAIGGLFAARSRTICLYAAIILTTIVLVGNPLVLSEFVKLSINRLVYITVFDLLALMVLLLAIRYAHRGARRDLVAAVIVLIAWPSPS